MGPWHDGLINWLLRKSYLRVKSSEPSQSQLEPNIWCSLISEGFKTHVSGMVQGARFGPAFTKSCARATTPTKGIGLHQLFSWTLLRMFAVSSTGCRRIEYRYHLTDSALGPWQQDVELRVLLFDSVCDSSRTFYAALHGVVQFLWKEHGKAGNSTQGKPTDNDIQRVIDEADAVERALDSRALFLHFDKWGEKHYDSICDKLFTAFKVT